jgi:urease accessory protein
VSLSLNKTRKAQLELTFGVREGKTYIARQSSTTPLKIWRPFAIDSKPVDHKSSDDGRVLVQIVNVSPGVMAGDDYRLEFHLQPNAKVVLVNQSATKLHQMPEGLAAKQNVTIHLEEGSELEYYPGLTIPFPDAAFEQNINVELSGSAKFSFLESWAMGRVERGETFVFRQLSSRLRVKRVNKLMYADALELRPSLRGVGILGGHTYLANGLLSGKCEPALLYQNDMLTLVTGQLSEGQTYLRALAKDGLELKTRLDTVVKTWRAGQGRADIVFSRFTS